MPNVLIHGWRDVNHSFSIVNQYQLIHLLKRPELRLFHDDAPYINSLWSAQENSAKFTKSIETKLQAIPAPNAVDPIDWAYSITYPHVLYRRPIGYPQPQRVCTFMVCEFGIKPGAFEAMGVEKAAYTSNGNLIVTPSSWSAQKLMESGFDPAGIRVIPHGVDPEIFHGKPQEERRLQRQQLNIPQDAFLFLNLGAMTANKGIEVLVQAFAVLRTKYSHIRLLLKDQRNLYKIKAEDVVAQALGRIPNLINDDTVGSIRIVTKNLTPDQLAILYSSVDAYVSPYHAEGFNLPVIEAAACETPVIVTRGGPTDDFCPDHLSLKIDALQTPNSDIPPPSDYHFIPGYHLTPSFESLVAQMEAAILRGQARNTALARHVLEHYSWAKITEQLGAVFCS